MPYGMNKAEVNANPQSGGRVPSKVASVIISKTCRCELSGYLRKILLVPTTRQEKVLHLVCNIIVFIKQ